MFIFVVLRLLPSRTNRLRKDGSCSSAYENSRQQVETGQDESICVSNDDLKQKLLLVFI